MKSFWGFIRISSLDSPFQKINNFLISMQLSVYTEKNEDRAVQCNQPGVMLEVVKNVAY